MGRPLVFALNGERVELAAVDPRTTLLSYIRSQSNLQGTKQGCGEGGCGACTVLLSKYDLTTERVEELTINSCLALLCSVDGCALTTTEGLKTAKNGCHVVHKRLAGFHGSQCGFCTPGMSMSIYGGLRKAVAAKASCSNGHTPVDASNGLSALEATKAIYGNICRCTGYRPILDTCRSFAGDVDVEDLGLNSFWASKQKADAALLPPYNPEEDPQFPSFLIDELKSRSEQNSPSSSITFNYTEGREEAIVAKRQWLTATSLSNAFALLESYSNGKHEVKLVVGNTSAGVYKDIHPEVYIDISHIPELFAVKASGEILEVGAGLTLTKLIDILDAEVSKSKNVVYQELAKHVRQIASEQVRNRASLGGNLILAQKLGFDSDLATILLGAGTEVTVASAAEGQSTVSLENFLSQGDAEPAGRILISVRIPSWNELFKSAKLLFKTYRISCRPSGNAVSYINAAFLAVVDEGTLVVRKLRLAFGAWGGAYAVRAWKTEKLLEGKSVTPAGLLEAIDVLKEEINPPPTYHKSAYRRSVAVGFLFDFFNSSLLSSSAALPVEDDEAVDAHTAAEHGNGTLANGTALSNGTHSNGTALSNGASESVPDKDSQYVVQFGSGTNSSQKFATSKEFWPVNQPTEKTFAQLQASGEAVYIDDITPVKGTLYGVMVLSDERPGKILSIDATEALKSPGAVDFFSAKDIPGKNVGFDSFGAFDRVFAEDKVECVNDVIGVMVADSYENAKEAASKIKLNVEEKEGCIYTIDEAIAKESWGSLGFFGHVAHIAVGEDPVKGHHRIEKAEVYSGSQSHFYMETNAAYAIPDEDNCMTVYSSNQAPIDVQRVVAQSLGVLMNSVRVITRRCGGAFGGKWSRACLVAVASAIAASKLRRPVKIFLDRQTDMRLSMGRHETKTVYSVDFNDDGKIIGLQANIYANAGRSKDASFLVLHQITESLRQYDWGSLRMENKICKTDTVCRGIMRGPGDIQGHFVAETVAEHVAAYLGMDAWKVKEKNMHTIPSLSKFFPGSINDEDSYTLPYICKKLKDQSQFERRRLAVKKFNESSIWEKKGIDMVFGIYYTGFLTKQARVSVFEDGSVVVEVGGIEVGQGLWTKVQQAVSFGLSKLWGPDAHPQETVSTSRIRIVQNDSISLPNQVATGGSTTSEASCMACLSACEKLVESLKPFLNQLRASGATPAAWETILLMASTGGAPLTAQGIYGPGMLGYLNFGVCVSEVSINVLTGSTSILQTDLLYDCGRSLNPAVDIGQIEGAFVMGVGFYLTEELTEEDGKLRNTGTWDYKPPTADNIPKRFNVELSNTKPNRERVLSSKASGEPPILLAKSVHSAVRNAIAAARDDLQHVFVAGKNQKANGVASNLKAKRGGGYFRLDTPVSIDKVKTLCGLDNVERYLASLA